MPDGPDLPPGYSLQSCCLQSSRPWQVTRPALLEITELSHPDAKSLDSGAVLGLPDQ